MNNGEQFFNTSGGGYEIERSLRFNSSDSAYLSKNFGSAGNRKTWTWAGWVKLGKLGSTQRVFKAADTYLSYFSTTGTLYTNLRSAATNYFIHYANVYRDPSAWYHIVLAVDTTQAIAANRQKLYVNGVQATAPGGLGQNYPPQNEDTGVNSTSNQHQIAGDPVDSLYFNGYLADIHFIDGQALDPSSFGEFDTNGVWQPKAYSGSYGTNGFYLPFSDNSTVAALGTDTSGNGNDWTPNNLVANESGVFRDVNFAIGTNTQGATDGPGSAMFDGTYGTGWGAGQTARTNEYTLTTAVPIPAGELWAFVFSSKTGVSVVVENSGGSTRSNTITTLNTYHWLSLGASPGSIKKIRLVDTNPNYGGLGIVGFRVDSTRLVSIDPAFIVDSLVDSPTNYGEDTGAGGEVRGNYCTWNPLYKYSSTYGVSTLSNGNLDVTAPNASGAIGTSVVLGTLAASSGKYYFEVTTTALSTQMIGIAAASYVPVSNIGREAGCIQFYVNDRKIYNQSATGSTTTAVTGVSGDVYGVAFDLDAATVTFYQNGNNVGQVSSTLSGPVTPLIGDYGGIGVATSSANFGQRPFAYTAPSGFKALCTTNLPEPTIADGSTAMDVALYTGNGSTQSISGLNFSPDLVWLKIRNTAGSHGLWDAIRGTSARLDSGATGAEDSTVGVTALNSDGFTVGGPYNSASNTWVAWTWDAGSSTVTNNDGSITSQVRANPSAGFSVVTWTGGGVDGSVGHGLGVAPKIYIIKNRSAASNWAGAYTIVDGSLDFMILNLTNAAGNATQSAPTSTVINLQQSAGETTNGNNYVIYAFAPVDGYSSFGSYTGNFVSDGPFVYTGFRPRFLLIKNSTDTTYAANYSWALIDTQRYPYNSGPGALNPLWANRSFGENQYGSGTGVATELGVDVLSNGFKLRCANAELNYGNTYIYAAFAEHPFATARAR